MPRLREALRFRYTSPPPTLRLLYQGREVGQLSKERDSYVFRYLDAFRDMGLAPLPGLHDLSKEYRSFDLPRFFAERIPAVDRPEVRESIRQSGISGDDKLALLAELGRYSVTDPFELVFRKAA